MEGVVQYITASQGLSWLVDENGVSRYFDHSQLTSVKIKVHDAVEFDFSANKITNITLVRKHKKGIVFYWE